MQETLHGALQQAIRTHTPVSISPGALELVCKGWVDTMGSAFSADREGYQRYQEFRKLEERVTRFKARLERETDEDVYDWIQAQVEESTTRLHDKRDEFEGYPAAEIHNTWNDVYIALSGKDLCLRDIPDSSDL